MLRITDLELGVNGFTLGPIDIDVGEEVVAILGPSGCGKTTMLSALAGIRPPDTGRVELNGRRLDGQPPEQRGLGLVFQDGALFPHLTARENVAYAGTDDETVESLAERLEITGVLDQPAPTLSGGERQRVALARALAADPDALLLDEPLTNLDAPIKRRLRDELHDLFRSLELPVIYVTHDQQAATALGDRIAVMREGEFDQVADPDTVLERPATTFVASFTGSENVLPATVTEAGAGQVTLTIGGVSIEATGTAPVGARVTTCVRPARIQLADRAALADGGNVVMGIVRRWLHEGDAYRLSVDIDGVSSPIEARISAVDLAADGPAPGDRIHLAIPKAAIHVIDDSRDGEPVQSRRNRSND